MNLATKRGPDSVATSAAFLGHRIGHADGLDRATLGLFAKKPSNFSGINPQSWSPLRFFSKKPSNFTEINPQSRPPSSQRLVRRGSGRGLSARRLLAKAWVRLAAGRRREWRRAKATRAGLCYRRSDEAVGSRRCGVSRRGSGIQAWRRLPARWSRSLVPASSSSKSASNEHNQQATAPSSPTTLHVFLARA